MLTILSSIVGFVGGFVPDILKYFKQKQDNAHELAVLQLQMQAQAQYHTQRLEEINAQADIAESEALYKSAEVKPSGVGWADALIYIANGLCRPSITYIFVWLYVAVKVGQFYAMWESKIPWSTILVQVWSEFDQSALMLVISYYFGQRMATRVFRLK
jgi:hypothetical protein